MTNELAVNNIIENLNNRAVQNGPSGVLIKAWVTSFGFGHTRTRLPYAPGILGDTLFGAVPDRYLLERPDMIMDVRRRFRDPHVSAEHRNLTGLDPRVQRAVLTTPGVVDYIDAVARAAVAIAPTSDVAGIPGRDGIVRIGFGCVGGKHRSVVISDAVAWRMGTLGVPAWSEHLHVNLPVLERPVG